MLWRKSKLRLSQIRSASFILIRLRTCRRGNVYAQIAIGTYDLFIGVQIDRSNQTLLSLLIINIVYFLNEFEPITIDATLLILSPAKN